MADQTVLAFDTSAAHCAAALLCNGVILGTRFEAMQKGQAEALVPLIQTLLAETQTAYAKLAVLASALGLVTLPASVFPSAWPEGWACLWVAL